MLEEKKQYRVEILLKTSPELLFTRLSTYTGLAEWFADSVSSSGNRFTFKWKDAVQEADVVLKKEPKLIRFKLLDDESEAYYFEFSIDVDDITKDTSLTVTDFAEEDDIESSTKLWMRQLEKLKHLLGAA